MTYQNDLNKTKLNIIKIKDNQTVILSFMDFFNVCNILGFEMPANIARTIQKVAISKDDILIGTETKLTKTTTKFVNKIVELVRKQI